MTDKLDKFDICSKLSPKLKEEIKIFHVFDDSKGINILFITSDDKVFGFGTNSFGCCGLGHNSVVNEPQVIHELCNKNIKQFFIGYYFILALESDHQLYGWGANGFGQLGRGHLSNRDKFLKPVPINIPNENIIQVSCGAAHTLALTLEGNVYVWGNNGYGQLGHDLGKFPNICKPTLLESFGKLLIKHIYCSYYQSFAITSDGRVYSCGENPSYSLGHELEKPEPLYEPTLIYIPNIIEVCSSTNNTYFLTNEGLIYYCGLCRDERLNKVYQKSPKLLSTVPKQISLHSLFVNYQKNTSIAMSFSGQRIYLLSKNSIVENKLENLFEYVCEEYRMTYKTIELKGNRRFLLEIKQMLENLDQNSTTDLKTIIQQKRQYFEREPNEAMNTIEFYISCQLFQELLECVQYLHESNPPKIVGNLRPDNIIVYSEQIKGRFLRIGGFNSSNFDQTSSIEDKYSAPEIRFGRKSVKSVKSDIYSLASIALELFDFDISEEGDVTENCGFKMKWKALKKLIMNMMDPDIKKRPDAFQILLSKNDWSINLQELHGSRLTHSFIERKDFNSFFQTYFNTRLMYEIDSNIFDSNDYSTQVLIKDSDVVFIVNKERIPSNTLLLMTKNNVFNQLFNGCNERVIIAETSNVLAFKTMLQFIYWNRITFENNEEDIDFLINVYKCAKRYKVKQLMAIMSERINTLIDVKSIEAIYGFAEEFKLGDLIALVEQYLTEHIEEIINENINQLSKINKITDNYLLQIIINCFKNQKKEIEKFEQLKSLFKPSGSKQVFIDKVKYSKVNEGRFDENDSTLIGVKISNLSIDLVEE